VKDVRTDIRRRVSIGRRYLARHGTLTDALIAVVGVLLLLIVVWKMPRGLSTAAGFICVILAAFVAYAVRDDSVIKAAAKIVALAAAVGALAGLWGFVLDAQKRIQHVPGPAAKFTAASYSAKSILVAKDTDAVIYSCAKHTCRRVAELPSGTRVQMVCYAMSEWFADRYRSNEWFKIAFQLQGRRRAGFAHSSDVVNQPVRPACKSG
jgi:hypothetical protein